MEPRPTRITLTAADQHDREQIYAIRHDVYARELGQHPENSSGLLRDVLDEVNMYLVAKRGRTVVGFVALTPPNRNGYSIDKYFSRETLPLVFDAGLYEVRLLTVVERCRRRDLAWLLMYGALRYLESRGARTVAAIGRLDVCDLYARVGLVRHGLRARAGAVTYELMSAEVRDLRARLDVFADLLGRLERAVAWQVPGVSFRRHEACVHGGSFFAAIGDEFDELDRRHDVISADVLDAWFDPAPAVTGTLTRVLPFALKTSPPTGCEGMRRVIARERRVVEESILPGAGSSDLIFAALRRWVTPSSHVLMLDPMYGEYAHLLSSVVGASVDQLRLSRAEQYELDGDRLSACVARGYDWVVLVNPNSPTGRHIPRERLEQVLAGAPGQTRFWLDETYVEYAGEEQSLESYASTSANVVVCKSMSKVYGLSGVRAGYLCGPPSLIAEARRSSPPWSVSLPAQMAACEALKAVDYYRMRWAETRTLRSELREGLEQLGWDVVPGCANFLLCHLPPDAPDAASVVRRASHRRLFLRDVSGMGTRLGRRAVRIAVKDRPTNAAILERLHQTLADTAQDHEAFPSRAHGRARDPVRPCSLTDVSGSAIDSVPDDVRREAT